MPLVVGPLLDNTILILILILILGRLISDCSITSINDIVFVFDHIQLKIIIGNKKTAFYNWKTNGRIKDIHDPFLLEKKITTYELRENCRKEIAQKRIQERQTITEARTSDKTLFYRIIRQQLGN